MTATPKLIPVPIVRDPRGAIGILEPPIVNFVVRRVYYIVEVEEGCARGSHAHRSLWQILVCLAGSFTVTLDDGLGGMHHFALNSPEEALSVPPGYWRRLEEFSTGSVCLVLASEVYDEADYIRDYEEFVVWKSQP